MAKLRYGAIVLDTRGSIGGVTFSASKQSATARSRVSRRSPDTPPNAAQKNYFGGVPTLWNTTLTDGQRDDWIALAATIDYTDVFGNTYHVSGINLFTQVNARRHMAGLAPLTDAPADGYVAALTSISLSATAPSTIAITFSPSPTPTAHALYVRASWPMAPGRGTKTDLRRVILASATAISSPLSISAAYLAAYKAMPSGRKILIGVRQLNTATGALSAEILASATVA